MITGYVGTYTSDLSQGIYRFELDESTGVLSNKVLFKKIKNSKYIACNNEYIYSLYDGEGGSGVLVMNHNGDLIDSLLFEKVTSCFIGFKGNDIYTANYHEGTVSKLKFDGNKLQFIKTLKIKDMAGCHQVIFFQDKLIVPCLFLDEVKILNEDLEIIDSIELPKGSGPRHGVISTDNKRLYLNTELSNELFTYEIVDGKFKCIYQMSILPNSETNKEGTAALRISRNGRKLYISTRGLNIITVVDIGGHLPKLLQFEESGGNHPRDILDVANDKYLLVANRFSNELLAYRLLQGRIGIVTSKLDIPEGVSIVMKGDLND